MLAHPPEILITTPESLNLILSSPNSRLMLDGVAAVILDEIHAVAPRSGARTSSPPWTALCACQGSSSGSRSRPR